MFLISAVTPTQTHLHLKRIRRRPYPLLSPRPPLFTPRQLLRGLCRSGGRGLQGVQTVFSKSTWASKARFHSRVLSSGGLHALSLVVGFLPRPRDLAHSAVLRSSLGGYALVLATQFHQLFSYFLVAPDNPATATALWAQKSWWWRLGLLAPHTPVCQVPLFGSTGFYATAAGSSALFISGGLWGSWAFLLLPSGQPKFSPSSAHVLLGAPHPLFKVRRAIILAGDARRYGQKPSVRGTAKNPNDHPNGGRTRSLKLSQTPWARPAKKSRKPRLAHRLKALAKRAPRKPQPLRLDV